MMKNTLKKTAISLALLVMTTGAANAASSALVNEVMTELKEIQARWAQLYYMDEFKNNNYKELQSLAKEANKMSHKFPQSAEALTWDAIVLSTLAEKKGGIGALSLVKEAKTKLETAEKIDPTVLDGSIYGSLATLYSKVPGWPVGFGNDKKARQYFQKALASNPDGLDINYFYAEYLADNDQDAQALEYVEKALKAPALKNRPLADAGRRKQAEALRDSLKN